MKSDIDFEIEVGGRRPIVYIITHTQTGTIFSVHSSFKGAQESQLASKENGMDVSIEERVIQFQ